MSYVTLSRDKKEHDGQMIMAFTFRFQNSINLFTLSDYTGYLDHVIRAHIIHIISTNIKLFNYNSYRIEAYFSVEGDKAGIYSRGCSVVGLPALPASCRGFRKPGTASPAWAAA